MDQGAKGTLHPSLCLGVFISIAVLTAAVSGRSAPAEASADPLQAETQRSAPAEASADPLQAETQRPRFESRVDLVMLPVSVLDSDGLPVEGLTPEDFLVLEDEAEQEVAILLSPRDAPLDIALLMDVSKSMRSIEAAFR